MITVRLMGGFGNQLFQAAYGTALSKRGYDVQYDKSRMIEGTHREYSLDYFGERKFGTPEGPVITEANLAFNPIYLSPPKTCTMVGYWQNEDYFAAVANEIRSEYWKLYPGKNPAFQEWEQKIHESESVALHVRRQDYVLLQEFHGMPTMRYYRNALQSMGFQRKVFVFSDDLGWCRDNFPNDFYFVDGTNKYEDLYLMASCKHAVIANSSFSWWGAWLGERPRRMVVAPKVWFTNETVQAHAARIAPDRWLRI